MKAMIEKELMRLLAADIKRYCKDKKQCTDDCAFYSPKNTWGYECMLQNGPAEDWEV